MKKKYYILALTFLCMLVGHSSYGQVDGGDYGPLNIEPIVKDLLKPLDNYLKPAGVVQNDTPDPSTDALISSIVSHTDDTLSGSDPSTSYEMYDYLNWIGDLSDSIDYSTIGEEFLNSIPVVGALNQSGEALSNGNYWEASGYFLWAGLDLYTLGAFTEASIMVRASTVIAEEIMVREAAEITFLNRVTEIPKINLPPSVASSFENSIYKTVSTNETVTLSRVFGNQAYLNGGFATTTANATRTELALLDEWNNSMQFEAFIKIPPGETLQIGKVAEQTSTNGLQTLSGGGNQILLPQNWDYQNWVEKIVDKTTGIEYTFGQFQTAFSNIITP